MSQLPATVPKEAPSARNALLPPGAPADVLRVHCIEVSDSMLAKVRALLASTTALAATDAPVAQRERRLSLQRLGRTYAFPRTATVAAVKARIAANGFSDDDDECVCNEENDEEGGEGCTKGAGGCTSLFAMQRPLHDRLAAVQGAAAAAANEEEEVKDPADSLVALPDGLPLLAVAEGGQFLAALEDSNGGAPPSSLALFYSADGIFGGLCCAGCFYSGLACCRCTCCKCCYPVGWQRVGHGPRGRSRGKRQVQAGAAPVVTRGTVLGATVADQPPNQWTQPQYIKRTGPVPSGGSSANVSEPDGEGESGRSFSGSDSDADNGRV